MLYVTGDTHNEPGRFAWIEQIQPLNETDILIVCGDFGYLNSEIGERELDWISTRPYTVCFCDGNHENFARLDAMPVTEWNGGSVHPIRKNVFHLMRGEIFLIQGKRVFVMGGAYSGEAFAENDSRELPNDAEYNRASQNLQRVHRQVDVIISHTAPREILMRMGKRPYPQEAELNGFLEWMMYEVTYKRWYFGHLHQDETIAPNFRAVHFDVCRYDA